MQDGSRMLIGVISWVYSLKRASDAAIRVVSKSDLKFARGSCFAQPRIPGFPVSGHSAASANFRYSCQNLVRTGHQIFVN